MKKIRCVKCGHIIAEEIEPVEKGAIEILCHHKLPNGQKCHELNRITKKIQ